MCAGEGEVREQRGEEQGNSVGDPHGFWPLGSGSIIQRYGSGSGSESFHFLIKVLRGQK